VLPQAGENVQPYQCSTRLQKAACVLKEFGASIDMLKEKANLYIEEGGQAHDVLLERSNLEDQGELRDFGSESPLLSNLVHFNGVQLDFLHVVFNVFNVISRLVAEWDPRSQTDSVRTQL
jgi:hypothetical protein